MSLGKSRVQFYSLYMHLADETKIDKPVEWIGKSEAWKKTAKTGEVTLLDEPIDAGAMIGHVGTAGPAELSKSQVHVEFFSTSELFSDVPGSPWTFIDGTAGGRFCEASQVNEKIDTDNDGMLSRPELSAVYSGGRSAPLRYFVTLHVSEWTAEPSWADALRVPKDFKKYKPAEIDEMVAEQITPSLWWDARVAAHCRLPVDGVVYHYHPVAFLGWFNQQLLDAAATAGPGAVNASDAKCRRASPTTSATSTARRCARRRTCPKIRATRRSRCRTSCRASTRRSAINEDRRQEGLATAYPSRVRGDARCSGGLARAARGASQGRSPAVGAYRPNALDRPLLTAS
jgi:hypothetical protein